MKFKLLKQNKISTFEKWQEMQKDYCKEGYGEIFVPIVMYEKHGIGFFENLEFTEDYKVKKIISFGVELAAGLEVQFANRGIKKLLKTNQKMIDEVERLWADYCENSNDEVEMKVQK